MTGSATTSPATMNVESTLAYPLPTIKIDPDQLLDDLKRMEDGLWRPQSRYKADVTNWDGISLYSVNGDIHDLRAADRLPVYKTPAGEKCPYICNELLPQFGAPCLRVVFYRLRAGTQIGEHRDIGENRFTTGVVRIHIPVITNEKVVMYVGGNPYHFPVGTAWYFDASVRHAVQNNSDQDRIHLVADLKVCRTLNRLLKPLTVDDRLRFARHTFTYYLATARMFLRFVRTKEGRARIRARAAIVFGRPTR
jgi:hypothetical protein